MTDEVYDLLWSLRSHHPEFVFTFVAERTKDGRVRGRRYRITAAGWNTVWTRHAKPVLQNFRFHDTRHTAATRLVRATGNLKLAQRLLGHSTLAMTSRYAHVTNDDLRNGLELIPRTQTPTKRPTTSVKRIAKPLKEKKKP